MATTNRENCQDKIWCISSDAYPVKPCVFMEDAQCHLITSPVISIGECISLLKAFYYYYFKD